MAAVETTALLIASKYARRKECGRLDRGPSGVPPEGCLGGGRSSSTLVKFGFVISAASSYFNTSPTFPPFVATPSWIA
jgi:hypothetical protein